MLEEARLCFQLLPRGSRMSCYTRRSPKGLALAVAHPPYVPIPVGAAKATAAPGPSPAHCGAALRPIVRLFPARPMVGVAWPVAASAGALHSRRRKAHKAEDVHMHRFLGRSRPSALLLPLAWACSADACLRAGAAFMAVRKKKLLQFIDAPAISSVRSLILLEGARCPRRCGLGPTCETRRCSRGMVDGCILKG